MTGTKWAFVWVVMSGVVIGHGASAQSAVSVAADGGSPVVLSAHVALEMTDNRDNAPSGSKESSTDLVVTPRIDFVRLTERGGLELGYAPTLRWRSDPAPWQDETDLYHRLDLSFRHYVSPLLRFRFFNHFEMTEQDAIEEDGLSLRGDRSYWANRTVVGLNYDLGLASNADIAGSYRIRRFDDDATARNYDEDERFAMLTLRHQLTEVFRVLGMVKAIQVGYTETELDRDFSSMIAAIGFERELAENLMASFVAGWQGRSYDDDTQTSDGLPYVQAGLHGNSGPLRLSGMIENGLRASEVAPFSSQEYLDVSGSVTAQMSGKVDLVGRVIYRHASYDEDQTPSGTVPEDFNPGMARSGDRTTMVIEAGVDYRATEKLRLGFRQRFEDVDSDVDASFSKNTTRLILTAWF